MYEIQQWIADNNDWFTVACFDGLAEAEAELATLRADAYYSKFQFRLYCDQCPN